jgi:hypothetical protein
MSEPEGRGPEDEDYSAWTPAFSMIGRHRSICEASLARSASGVAWVDRQQVGLDAGELLGDRLVLHDLAKRLVQSGDDRLGVPTRASTSNHMPIERLGTPCSAAVGTSRSEAMRSGAVSR